MKAFVGPRQTGKTTELIKVAEKHFAYIVCADYKRARHVQGLAIEMGMDIPFPITHAEFLHGRFSRGGIKAFIVDDVECMLRELARGVPVVAYAGQEELDRDDPPVELRLKQEIKKTNEI